MVPIPDGTAATIAEAVEEVITKKRNTSGPHLWPGHRWSSSDDRYVSS